MSLRLNHKHAKFNVAVLDPFVVTLKKLVTMITTLVQDVYTSASLTMSGHDSNQMK